MFVAKVESLVQRPIGEVFAFVEDARNRPQWDPSVVSEELTSPEPITIGTTLRTRLRSMGRSYEYTWEVTEHVRPRRMVITSTSGPMPTRLEFQLSSEDGATRIRFAVTGRPTGAMRVLQPIVNRSTRRNLDVSFARLTRLLEQRSDSV